MAERREQLNGVNPRRALDDTSIAARKQAFLLLWKRRTSLRAELRQHGHLKGRYEDLFLITLLARLERDWLTQPLPSSRGPRGPRAGDGERLELGVAEWAQPWGVAFLTALHSDLYNLEEAVKRLGKWLPPRPRMAAERRARERLERIEAELEEGSARVAAVEGATGERATEKEKGAAGPSATRVAATAATLVAAAAAVAGLLLVTSNSDNGVKPSASARRGTEASPPPVTLPAIAVHGRHRPAKLGAGHEARGTGGPPSAVAPPTAPPVQQAAQSVPVSAGVSAPTPAPSPTVESTPPPAPQPVSTTPSPAPTQDQGASTQGGGGCPPEFGFDC